MYRNLFLSGTSRDLAESSICQYEELGGLVQLKGIGYLWTFSPEDWAVAREQAQILAGSARAVELLEGRDLRAATGIDPGGHGSGPFRYPPAAGAILGRACGSLSAQALAGWYAKGFVQLGGSIHTDTRIVGFDLDGETHRAEQARPDPGNTQPRSELPGRVLAAVTRDGTRYQAGTFLITAGCWLQDILGPLGIASGVYPKKRQLFVISVPDNSSLYGSGSVGRPVMILPYGGVYLKPVPDRDLVIVGRADDLGRAFEPSYTGDTAYPQPEEGYFRTYIEPVLCASFPELAKRYPKGLDLRQAWAGHYDYHWPDRNPVVEQVANVIWAGGSSGSGIMKGDALGRIAAAAVTGEETVSLADGRRFKTADLSLRRRAVQDEGLVI